MELTREQVRKVSLLARLELSDEELELMTSQLAQVVNYIGQLEELDTEGIEPMAHAHDVQNVFAADQPHGSLSPAEALANAPKHDQDHFQVPAVLGD